MPLRLALFGLNRLGGSLAAALTNRAEITVVGFDNDPDTSRIAQSRGYLKRVEWTMPNTVDKADLVLIAQPLDELKDTLTVITPHLREGCVVASIAPLLLPPLEWGRELIPAGCHFVACHPVPGSAHLFDQETGLDAAHADLFTKGLWALAPAPACAPEALKLIGDLATLVGATPYFVDPAEHDGVMGGAEALPTLLAWVLTLTATMSPGWPELRKFADRNFAAVTRPLADPISLSYNQASVLRHLDSALAELKELRELIASGNAAAITTALDDAQSQHARWLTEHAKGEWETTEKPVDIPTVSDNMGRLFMGNLFGKMKGEKKD